MLGDNMEILAQQNPPASKQVKSISKYIYNRLDGAHNIRYKSNMCEIDVTVLYTIPQELVDKVSQYNISIGDDIYEMEIRINVTTYQNKIRIDTIEITPEERTLGCDVFKPEDKATPEEMLNKVKKRLSRRFKGYDFVF